MISWLITLVVIRLLSPADYGLMAMATIFIAFFEMFSEFGLGAAIIQEKNIDQHTIQKIFGIVLILDFSLILLLVGLAPVVALFFEEPQLIPIVRLLALKFVLLGLCSVPQAILQRELKFKPRALVELVANLMGAFSTLGLALAGKGVWALVWGSMLLSLTRAIGLNLASPFFVLPIFSLKGTRRMVSFGGILMIGGFMRYIYNRIDTFIIGKFFGKELLGFFSVGKELSFMLSNKVTPIIHQVVFPAFSRIQDQPDEVSYYTFKGMRIISLVTFPVFWGFSSVAPEFVAVFLGNKWMFATIPLTWISLIVPLAVMNGIILWILRAVGRADVGLKNITTAFIILPLAILLGSHWELPGVSLAWLTGYTLYFVIAVLRSSHYMGLRKPDIFRAMTKPVFACIIMYIAVAAIRTVSQSSFSPLPRLPLLAIAGAIVYVGLQLSMNREGSREIIEVIKRIKP